MIKDIISDFYLSEFNPTEKEEELFSNFSPKEIFEAIDSCIYDDLECGEFNKMTSSWLLFHLLENLCSEFELEYNRIHDYEIEVQVYDSLPNSNIYINAYDESKKKVKRAAEELKNDPRIKLFLNEYPIKIEMFYGDGEII